MSLDPQLLALLQAGAQDLVRPIDWAAVRQGHTAMAAMLAGAAPPPPVKSVENYRFAGPAGELAVRVYAPEGPPTMTVIHFHGGGWVLGDLDSSDHTVRRICHRLQAVVVSCTYRLAPEHPFPAAYEDALAATRWVLTEAGRLGGDPRRVVIAGDSAGGNLAAAVTIALRDEARSGGPATALPPLRAQLLLYPGVDVRASALEAGSMLADRDPSLPAPMIGECISTYTQGADRGDWRVSPLAAGDLSGLPPAMVVLLEVDPLHDQGLHYAQRLGASGVPCELVEFPHLTHGFSYLANVVPAAASAFDGLLAQFAAFVDREQGSV